MKSTIAGCHANIGSRVGQSSFRFSRGGVRSVLSAFDAGKNAT
jgi:hypothetical protein